MTSTWQEPNKNTEISREHAWLKIRIAHLCVLKKIVTQVSCLIPCRTWHWAQAQVFFHLLHPLLLSVRRSHPHKQDLWISTHKIPCDGPRQSGGSTQIPSLTMSSLHSAAFGFLSKVQCTSPLSKPCTISQVISEYGNTAFSEACVSANTYVWKAFWAFPCCCYRAMFSICWFTFITKAQLPILYPMAEYFPGAPCNEPLIASAPIQYVVIMPPECLDLSTVLCGVLCFLIRDHVLF